MIRTWNLKNFLLLLCRWGVQFSHYPQFSKILCSQLSALPQNHSSVGFKTPHFSLSSTSVAPPFSVSFLTSSTSNYPLNLDPFQGSLMDLRSSDCVRYLGNLNLFPWPQPPSFRQWPQYLYCHISPFPTVQTHGSAFRISPLGYLTDTSDSACPNWAHQTLTPAPLWHSLSQEMVAPSTQLIKPGIYD